MMAKAPARSAKSREMKRPGGYCGIRADKSILVYMNFLKLAIQRRHPDWKIALEPQPEKQPIETTGDYFLHQAMRPYEEWFP